MHKFKALIFILAAIAMTSTLAAAAIPGPQRMISPGLFGFEKIAPHIYAPKSMGSEARKKAIRDIDGATTTITDFFEQPLKMPNIILCPTEECDSVFGKNKARGIAYGVYWVRLNAKGINETIATHELSHIALKRRVGEWHSFVGAIPAWFDEGLATLISKDNRFADNYPPKVRQDLLKAGPWWNWSAINERHGWRAAYGESKNMVQEIEQKSGKAGIMRIIDGLADGKSFEEATLSQIN